MSPIGSVLSVLSANIAELTARLGNSVSVEAMRITDRSDDIALAPPGEWSPNGACRMVRAEDGWIAVNLARNEDRDMVSAWLEQEAGEDPWSTIVQAAHRRSCDELLAKAGLLGLPVSSVGEVTCGTLEPHQLRLGHKRECKPLGALKAVDLSALWAGPLCGAILAEMGVEVLKIEDARRPDATRTAMPGFYHRLNHRKSDLSLDFSESRDRDLLRAEIRSSDVVVTSARPRAFAGLGLSPQSVFAENPALVWVAITGYGWTDENASRVAFGDDAAAAGGLVHWTREGAPHFLGDALSDPVTGLSAAVGALTALAGGGGVLVDTAMARCAAGAAAVLGISEAA